MGIHESQFYVTINGIRVKGFVGMASDANAKALDLIAVMEATATATQQSIAIHIEDDYGTRLWVGTCEPQ